MIFTILEIYIKRVKLIKKKKKLGSACRKDLKPVYGAETKMSQISMSISLSDAQKINKDLLLRVFINNTSWFLVECFAFKELLLDWVLKTTNTKQKSKEDSFRSAEQKEKINACLSFEEKMREHSIKDYISHQIAQGRYEWSFQILIYNQ